MGKFNDEYLITPLIRQRLSLEAEDTQGNLTGFWAVLTRLNGETERIADTWQSPDPTQQMFAADMAQALNKHLRHDGAWIVFFTHPGPTEAGILTESLFRCWHFLWIDEDGDPQFTVDNEDAFHVVLGEGPDHWIDQAAFAWSQWKLMMKDVLDPAEGQTFKRAQGQAPVKPENQP